MGIGTLDWVDGGTGTWVPDLTNGEYYHGDMIGTTRLMTEASGSVLAGSQSVHTAFGQPTSVNGNHRYGYAGAWGYQAATSDDPLDPYLDFTFLHVGARYYDPATGRFLQRDPIGIRAGLNVYEYVTSTPTGRVDPDGTYPFGGFPVENPPPPPPPGPGNGGGSGGPSGGGGGGAGGGAGAGGAGAGGGGTPGESAMSCAEELDQIRRDRGIAKGVAVFSATVLPFAGPPGIVAAVGIGVILGINEIAEAIVGY